MKITKVYSHRGDTKNAPENTISAFRKAIDMSVDGIELDVQMTCDDEIVVIHDHYLGRTCNGSGMIKDMRYDQLRKLDFGGWFTKEFEKEKIPLLYEVIELIKDKNIELNIEIKATPGKYNNKIETEIVKIIKEHRFEERAFISSFNHYSLEKIKKEYEDIRIAPLFVGIFKDVWEYAKKIGAYAVNPLHEGITQQLLENCYQNDIKVNARTVDKPEDIERIISLGSDGIISNRPDVVMRYLKNRGE